MDFLPDGVSFNKNITYLAKTNFRNQEQVFGIKRRDRRQHMYVLGKSGSGKSALLGNMIVQNIWNGEGVCVVDPHGELVESVRGPGGGYTLARLARTITVADIIFAVDEPLDATNCAGKTDCNSGTDGKPGVCMTHELWSTLNRKMVDFLDSVSLQDLVDQQRMRQLQEATQAGQGVRVSVVSSTAPVSTGTKQPAQVAV